MKFVPVKPLRGAAVALAGCAAFAAQAHTGHGAAGLAQGLAHPLGADHLLAMVAVGVWSASALPEGKAWRGPATFLLALAASAALGAAGVQLPFLEHLIALSVVAFGAMLVASRRPLPMPLSLGLVALAGALHGLAHGAEAPASGFAPYALGFLATTALLHGGGVLVALAIRHGLARRAAPALAALGALCCGAGAYLLGQL